MLTRTTFKLFLTGGAAALACAGALAQPVTPGIDQREARQEQRIQQGVASGQLNARETHRLARQQARIHQTEQAAKADGRVSAKERAHLDAMQDKASRDIHQQKHDAQHAR